MIIVTTDEVKDRSIKEVLGLVQGNTVRARHAGRDIMAGLRALVGGEVSEYSRLMAESRQEAVRRMERQAEILGANAVVCTRLVTAMVMQGSAEMLAYGTAVILED